MKNNSILCSGENMPIGWGVKDLTSIPSSACGWFWASQSPDPCLSFPIDPSGIMIPYHLTKFFEINGWKLQSVIRKCCGELGLVINNKVLCRSFCTIFFFISQNFSMKQNQKQNSHVFPNSSPFSALSGVGRKGKNSHTSQKMQLHQTHKIWGNETTFRFHFCSLLSKNYS